MSFEHLEDTPIMQAVVRPNTDLDGGEAYAVGVRGVTRIEAFTKSGMHADIAYIRIWEGEKPIAEFCQHGILGIYFFK